MRKDGERGARVKRADYHIRQLSLHFWIAHRFQILKFHLILLFIYNNFYCTITGLMGCFTNTKIYK